MASNFGTDESFASFLQRDEERKARDETAQFNKFKKGIRHTNVNNDSSIMYIPESDDDVIMIDDDDKEFKAALKSSKAQKRGNALSPAANSDEMIARKLQEKFDKELAASLEKKNMSDRLKQKQPSRVFVQQIPSSFQTDMLYSMVRQPQDTNRAANHSSASASTAVTNPFSSDGDNTDTELERMTRNYRNHTNNSHFLNNFNNNPHQPTSSNYLRRQNNVDPVTNLTSAFSILSNTELMQEMLNENRNDRFAPHNIDDLDFNQRNPTRPEPFIHQPAPRQRRINNNNAVNNRARDNYQVHNYQAQFRPHFRLAGRMNPMALQFSTNDRDFTADDYENLLRLDEMNGVKKALSKTELNSLPEFDFKKTDSKEDDNSNVCSICYEEYASKDKLMALTCTHKFHKKCVKQWLQESRRCPLCQKDAISGE